MLEILYYSKPSHTSRNAWAWYCFCLANDQVLSLVVPIPFGFIWFPKGSRSFCLLGACVFLFTVHPVHTVHTVHTAFATVGYLVFSSYRTRKCYAITLV